MIVHLPAYRSISLFFVGLFVYSANTAADEHQAGSAAMEIAQKAIIVDGHIDVPYRLHEKWEDVTGATEKGDFDFLRAKNGGLNAPFMSIYVPAKLDDSVESTAHAHRMIDYVEAIVGRSPERFAIARRAEDVERHFTEGLVSLPLGMENGSAVQGSLETLEAFYDRGIRYITLTHAKSNHISDSSYDDVRKWDGLSEFGEQMVSRMNQLGIMVDISHVSDAAFFDALKISKAPMIASHSSLRHFTPGFERNMSDDMVKALAQKGGIIMINFGSSFLTEKANQWVEERTQARKLLEEEFGADSDEVETFNKQYREKNPFPFADLSDVVAHIDHAVNLVGIDHVGLGSDFDGVGDSLPTGLKDVSTYPYLIDALLAKDYSPEDIEKILGKNLLRVWRVVESVSTN